MEQVTDFYKTQNLYFTGEGNPPFIGDGGMTIQRGLQYMVQNEGKNGGKDGARVDVTKAEAVRMAIATIGTLWVGLRIYSQTLYDFEKRVQ